MSGDGNSAIYRSHLGCVNQGDLAGYLDLYSDGVVFGGVFPEPMDKAGVVAFHEASTASSGSPRCSRTHA